MVKNLSNEDLFKDPLNNNANETVDSSSNFVNSSFNTTNFIENHQNNTSLLIACTKSTNIISSSNKKQIKSSNNLNHSQNWRSIDDYYLYGRCHEQFYRSLNKQNLCENKTMKSNKIKKRKTLPIVSPYRILRHGVTLKSTNRAPSIKCCLSIEKIPLHVTDTLILKLFSHFGPILFYQRHPTDSNYFSCKLQLKSINNCVDAMEIIEQYRMTHTPKDIFVLSLID